MPRNTAEAPAEVYYPESDGQPMGETGLHVNASLSLFGSLKLFFRNRPDVYLTADMFFYFEEGNPRAVKAPDLMVIQGVTSREERRTYKLWVEKIVPSVIFEVTSAETRRDDTIIKRELYARLGVAEYFLFDPLGEYLVPRLQGFRLEGDRYLPIEPNAEGRFVSRELGLTFQAHREWIRMFDATSNRLIPSLAELGEISDKQGEELEILQESLIKQKKQLERQRKKAAREAEKAEIERQKAAREAEKAELERQKAAREAEKAEIERQKAAREAEKAELERQKAAREAEKAEIERQKAVREAEKAEIERQKAAREAEKAEIERQKSAALEVEVARLRALLAERESTG